MADLRIQQTAAAVAFFATGLVSATWAARVPATQERLQLSPGGLALVVAAIEGGALLGLAGGGALVGRLGSRSSLRMGFAGYAIGLLPLALAPSLPWLAGLATLWAAANSVVDVAMNAAGVELQAAHGRPLLSRLHAAQSAGLLAGGLAATGAAIAQLPLAVHFATIAAVGGVAVLAACTRLADRRPRGPAPVWVRPERRLVRLGVVAFCVFMIDGGATYWVAVELRTEHHAPDGVAAAAFALFTAAMLVARLGGDRACARFGRVRIVRWCGTLAALGALLVVLAPSAGAAITGWVAVGAGLAVLTPTVLGAATGRAGTGPPGSAIAAVTTLGYLGSFIGPPLIGAVAEVVGLSLALGLLVVAACCAVVIAPAALRDPAGRERGASGRTA